MNQKFNIEIRDINTIKPYDRNPRQNDDAVDAVAASLKEFSFRQPIVVDGDGVIGILFGNRTECFAPKRIILDIPDTAFDLAFCLSSQMHLILELFQNYP